MSDTFSTIATKPRTKQSTHTSPPLGTLAKTCEFCECLHDTLIRDRIVLGVQNQSIKKELLQERKLTLNKCIDICRSAESTASQLKAIVNPAEIHKISSRRKPQTSVKRQNPPKNSWKQKNADFKPQRKSCQFCGGEHSPRKEECPAWGQKCLGCGGRNHFRKVCRKNKPRGVHGISEQASDESHIEWLAGVAVDSHVHAVDTAKYAKEIYTEMIIDDKSVKFQIDCGASTNILPDKYVDKHAIKPTTKTLRMWNGSEVKPTGTARVALRNPKNRKKYSVEFIIVSGDLLPLIGARVAQQMNLITVHNENFTAATSPVKTRQPAEVKQLTTAEQLVQRYADVFDRPLGTLPGTVHLEVEPDVTPVITPARRIPLALKENLQKELERYVNLGIFEPVEEPTPWVSSVAVATKKSGALRICIDPRPLNKALKRETYQLKVLDEILPDLAQAKVFSTVDLRSGYWHCVLDEESSLLTTFATPYGRYRWCRLPFGLSASSEIFQKRVNQALEGLNGVLDIVDDILVYGIGESIEEANADHDKNLEALRGMALNKDKLMLKRKEVPFMGHILTDKGVKIDPENGLKLYKKCRSQKTWKGVQRLNGFVNYLAKFLPRLADEMEPMRRLTRKNIEWEWTDEQDKAFNTARNW